jgi:hypothetical protein
VQQRVIIALTRTQGDFPGRSAGSPQFHPEKSCICQDLEHLATQLDQRPDPAITVSRQRRTVFVAGQRQHRMVLRRS